MFAKRLSLSIRTTRNGRAGAFFLCRPPIRNLGRRLVSECGKFFAVRPVSAVYCRGGIT